MTAPDTRAQHIAIHLAQGGVAAINAVEALVRADLNLFVRGGDWRRRGPGGYHFRVTADWFAEYLSRHCVFIEDGKRVRPPGFVYEQIRRRMTAR